MFESQQFLNFIQQYGYWIIYPLMVIEGPIVTLVASGLSALGILRIEIIFLLSVVGDLTMDIILYYIGFYGNKRLRKYILKQPTLEKRRQLVHKFFKKHGGKMIFFVKISTGLCYITFITAGMVKMPLKRFLTFSLLGGILWSGLLVTLGYFYGHLYQEINGKIEQAGIIIIGLGIITLLTLSFIRKRKINKLLNNKLVP